MSLRAFLFRRLGGATIAVLGVSLLVVLFLHIVPGDPVDNLSGGDATPDQRAALITCMHLDRSIPAQYGIFLRNVGNGTLGRQCPDAKGRATVAHRIAAVFPYTLALALAGMAVALLLALPLGVIAAIRRGTLADAAASVVSLAGISIPSLWMGPILLFVFYVQLAWVPGPAEPDARGALLLPAIVVGTHLMAMLARMTRSSMLDVLGEDYVRTARAKGLAETVVVAKHALRNALLPVITVAGIQFGSLLAGAIVVERVFARPGLGTLLYDAIRERNYPVIQGCVLVIAVFTVAMNLLVDVAYGFVDPRIRRA